MSENEEKQAVALIEEIRASVLIATATTDIRMLTRAVEARMATGPAPKSGPKSSLN